MTGSARDRLDGVPVGSIDAVLEVLAREGGPLRRRPLLEALARRGHRVSLAGLNRILEYCRADRLTVETPDGVRLASAAPPR